MVNGSCADVGCVEYPPYKAGEFKWSDGEYGIKMLVPATLDEMYRLAVLYIPKGAIVYVPGFTQGAADDFMKRRASKAYVIEICAVTRDPSEGIVLHRANYGESMYRGKFNCDKIVYTAGKYVEPTERFSFKDCACDSGIHYFETVHDMGMSYLRESLYAAVVDIESTNITLETWYRACIDKYKKSVQKAHCRSCGTCEWLSTHISKEPCKSCGYDLNIHGFTNYEQRRGHKDE